MPATKTPPRTPPRPTVGKLPSRGVAARHRVAKGLAAVLGVLALLLGVPVALVLLVGNPLPTTAPSRDWLTAEVTDWVQRHLAFWSQRLDALETEVRRCRRKEER